ncbi:flippase [Halomicronema sp. CCY15110]|uniref:flippase n=1 Tax=Halomicronema sp. CCY15110 TaxID=2767773 RepID=UPI0019518FBC|nr:flippase [Halomicronema sp. CCY15110]
MLHKLIHPKGQVNTEFRQILHNTGWLFGGKVLRMVISLFVGTWIARYLRPEGFGQLQYALVLVSFFDPLSTIQMGQVVTRDLVRHPENSSLILGTAFVLQWVGGILAASLCVFGVQFLAPDQPLIQLLVSIIALKCLFNSLQPIANWFESWVASKYVVMAEHGVFLLIVLLKCGLVMTQATVVAFAIVIALESMLYALALAYFYLRQHQSIRTWRTNFASLKYLLRESWPLVLSSTAVVIYLNIDQLMLGNMIDKSAVGIYASAANLSEATAFLPVIIGSSLFPRIIQSRQLAPSVYRRRLQQYYDLNTAIAYSLILVLLPTSGFIMTHLYGAEYQAGIPIFAVHILASLFTYLGIAQSKWIVTEGLQRYNFYARFTGLMVNIVLNLVLIPRYGGMGAAIATLISYAIGGYLFFGLLPATRSNAYLMTKALLLPLRLLSRWSLGFTR